VSFPDRIRECNNAELSRYRPFEVAGAQVGWVDDAFAAVLAEHPDVFELSTERVRLNPALDSFETRTAAAEAALRALHDRGHMSRWRGERYPVAPRPQDPPLMAVERAAVPRLGIRAFGVHLNGYVMGADGAVAMWVGRRARDKPTYPGQLDNMVAGGQAIGATPWQTLVKEAAEEAAVPPELARQARPVGAITYTAVTEHGLRPDTQYCYDLLLPPDFEPRNTDGELEGFELWPIERVADTVRNTREFKFNCNLVIVDFLVRHGLIGPDHPDYLEIVRGLHQ